MAFGNIANGTWYRRVNGAECKATYWPRSSDRPIDFIQVIEPDCAPRTMPVENFFCFYCRKSQLAA